MLYFRVRMHESEAFVVQQQMRKEHEQAVQVEAQGEDEEAGGSSRLAPVRTQGVWSSLRAKLSALSAHRRALVACAGSWFIFDVVFYAQGFFSSTVLAQWNTKPLGPDGSAQGAADGPVHSYLVDVALASLVLALCALPGYFASVALIDRIGRRPLQLMGFAGMVVSYLLCAVLLPQLDDGRAGFLALYGLSFFFCNCGPNVSTFVIPSEAFPTSVRATAHGLAAAAGKMGAVLGAAAMAPLLEHAGLAAVMYACAGVSLIGLAWTYVLTDESQHCHEPLPQHEDNAPEIELAEHNEAPLKSPRGGAQLASNSTASSTLHHPGSASASDGGDVSTLAPPSRQQQGGRKLGETVPASQGWSSRAREEEAGDGDDEEDDDDEDEDVNDHFTLVALERDALDL